jgi:hypothetical protein
VDNKDRVRGWFTMLFCLDTGHYGSLVCRSLDRAELFLEHVHEQPVVPDAVGAALVLAHDPDPAKAHLLVSADRGSVIGRRIYREAVVAMVL